MAPRPFAQYLAGLDKDALTSLLRMRPDVAVEPVPRGFDQLAQRLTGGDSLALALRGADRDMYLVGGVATALGSQATVTEIARVLAVPELAVRDVIDRLLGRGMAWTEGNALWSPERLAEFWSADIGGGKLFTAIARMATTEELRDTAVAWGIDPARMRKAELIESLAEVLGDASLVAAAVAELPAPVRLRLDELRRGEFYGYLGRLGSPADELERALGARGLLVRVRSRWELPWEVAIGAWLAGQRPLSGMPGLPGAAVAPGEVRAAAQAAVDDLLRAVTGLLDAARTSPIAALKRGGIGARERNRLATRHAVEADVLAVCLDVAFAAGLLGPVTGGYAPTEEYRAWRAESPSRQWARLANAWYQLEYAPTRRESLDEKEVPPPLQLATADGQLRRAILRAAGEGRSVRAAGAHVDWFFPLHGNDAEELADRVAATVRECELLGVVAGDVVTEPGQRLLSAVQRPEPAAELAAMSEELLPERPCSVVVQSDLTAIVSGRPTESAAAVLSAAAVSETRGTAAVWRFTPESVRGAMDAGWTAADLLAELASLSGRSLPQPLEYLVNDVARQHGRIRVRGMRSSVLADEATTTELLHQRSLRKLHLARLAPTVLSSPCEPDEVLAALRAAGMSPVTEDATGAVIVETPAAADDASPVSAVAARSRLGAVELAEQLLADPEGELGDDEVSDLVAELRALNRRLDHAELVLLADAIERQRDVTISYVARNGSQTLRPVRPRQLYGHWLDSWCYLRGAQRDFTVANIESVAPAG